MSVILEKPQVLEDYLVMPDEEMHERIEAAREGLGPRVVILGHHYQRDDVIRHADLTGEQRYQRVMLNRSQYAFDIIKRIHKFVILEADG